MTTIILIGFMGAGKSTVGQALATSLNLPFIDIDAQVVAEIQMPIAQFFAEKGEGAFRKIESKVLREQAQGDSVIATGGGVVLDEINRTFLGQQTHVFYLSGTTRELLAHIAADKKNRRPLATEKTFLEMDQLHQGRVPLYLASSTKEIITSNKTIAEIVAEISKQIEEVAP